MHRNPIRLFAFALLAAAILAPSVPAASRTAREEAALIRRAQELSDAFAIIARRIRPAVVNIKVERRSAVDQQYNDPLDLFREFFGRRFPRRLPRERKDVGQGSGVIVDERGYILTNNHVVGDAETIVVKLADGREVSAELVGSDPDTDVAVVRIEAERITAAPMGNSDAARVGEFVLAVGNPFGLESTITSGIISARGRSGVNIVEIEDFIQTDAAINPGNSGGPLVNLQGEVIGINAAIYSKSGGYQGIGFAIPINIARTVMRGIITNKKVTSSYLGVQVMPLSADLAEKFGLESRRGALVTEVLANTPAAKAGLRPGDVILRFRNRLIRDAQQLRNLVATTQPGAKTEVLYVRRGHTKTAQVRVEAVPEEVTIARRSQRILESMGIEIAAFDNRLRQKLGYDHDTWGVLVTKVSNPKTLRLGLRPGSLILRVNEIEVRSPTELMVALADADTREGLVLLWRTGRYLLGPVRLRFED